jgi:hypothetical protein
MENLKMRKVILRMMMNSMMRKKKMTSLRERSKGKTK